ncbi:uncharacterized protein LOC119077906 [Bradysia coprophila]|uniref:uncharacterized protein LOC119077906 n=1 Tax=Bradysia coprophila TaxID=38358 RepID=UPI00187DC315|nr:uncharacterized protein LOC119077906 [Bradysia coprophila]
MNPYYCNHYGMPPNMFGPQMYSPFTFPPPPPFHSNMDRLCPDTVASTTTAEVKESEKSTNLPAKKEIKRQRSTNRRRYRKRSEDITTRTPHSIHDKSPVLSKHKSLHVTQSRVTASKNVEQKNKRNRRKVKAPTNNPINQQLGQSTVTSGYEKQNQDFVVAVMAIAMALQPEKRSGLKAAPDGIELD